MATARTTSATEGLELVSLPTPRNSSADIGKLALVSFKTVEYDAGKVAETIRSNGFFNDLDPLSLLICMRRTWCSNGQKAIEQGQETMRMLAEAVAKNPEIATSPRVYDPFSTTANGAPDTDKDLRGLLSSHEHDGLVDKNTYFKNHPKHRIIALTTPIDARFLSQTTAEYPLEHVIYMRAGETWDAVPIEPANLTTAPTIE